MSDLISDISGGRAIVDSNSDDGWTPRGGRHALDEDAVLTPIFHALTRGGWRRQQHECDDTAAPLGVLTDPVDAFQRDPLTAPIPAPVLAPAPLRRGGT